MDVEARCPHLGIDVFRVGDVCCAVACDGVVIVDDAEVVELPVTRQRHRLETNTFLETRVPNHAPSHIVHQLQARLVVCGSQVLGRHRKPHSVRNTLTKGPCCDLHALVFDLGVSRTDGIQFRRVVALELLDRHALDPDEMHEEILPEASMA